MRTRALFGHRQRVALPDDGLRCRRVGRLTRSARKARDTQWTRDAVLNNPDLLCHIAEQTDLPTACKLLTTSKQNFVGGASFFDKQFDYYNDLWLTMEFEPDHIWLHGVKKHARFQCDTVHYMMEDADYFLLPHEEQSIEFKIMYKEWNEVQNDEQWKEWKHLQHDLLDLLDRMLSLLTKHFGVKHTAFDEDRKANPPPSLCERSGCKPDPERMFDCNCGTNASYCINCGEHMDCPHCVPLSFEADSLFDSESDESDESEDEA